MTVFSCIFYVACHTAWFSSNTQTHPRTARVFELENRSGTAPVGTSSFLFLLICNAVGYINDHLYLVGGLEHFLFFPFSREFHHPN